MVVLSICSAKTGKCSVGSLDDGGFGRCGVYVALSPIAGEASVSSGAVRVGLFWFGINAVAEDWTRKWNQSRIVGMRVISLEKWY